VIKKLRVLGHSHRWGAEPEMMMMIIIIIIIINVLQILSNSGEVIRKTKLFFYKTD
jgi:hypothetical protein